MDELREELSTAVEILKDRILRPLPEAALITGSGLGGVVDTEAAAFAIPYTEVPGLPPTTVPGHPGALGVFELGGVRFLYFWGRAHLYEGHPVQRLGMCVRVAATLGVKAVVITCTAGSLNKKISPGDLVVIRDHINMAGVNPLIGGPALSEEERFPDTRGLYPNRIIRRTLGRARSLGIRCCGGVYAWVSGPSYETPAEARMLSRLGADVVGMSLVPEALTAAALGMKVLAIACVTNAAPVTGEEPLKHEKILESAKGMVEPLRRLLAAAAPVVIDDLNKESEPQIMGKISKAEG